MKPTVQTYKIRKGEEPFSTVFIPLLQCVVQQVALQ